MKTRAKCPVCNHTRALRANGRLHIHGPYGNRCTGSGEFVEPGMTSDLGDLRTTPLTEISDTATARTLNRIAPDDGNRALLVAASFNSAI